jgi:hypothetical protein
MTVEEGENSMSRHARVSVVTVSAVSLFVACSGVGRAAQPEGVERQGMIGGFSFGVGGLRQMGQTSQGLRELEETRLGPSFGFRVGAMLSKRTALLVDTTSVFTGSAMLSNHAAAVQYWVGKGTWVEAGVGTGLWGQEGRVTDPGFGFLTAIGWEVKQTQHRAIDVSLRYGTLAIGSARLGQLSLNLGFNWY